MITIEQLYEIYLQHPAVTTDSRQANKGKLFFALKGERFDGNKFAQKAIEQGAEYAIIDDSAYQLGDRYLLVENVLKTLQDLALYHRQQFDIPVIAITGSNGKTTTKELLSEVMSSHYPTHTTQGNFNNHIGVPLTLLKMPIHTEVAIIEMGANHVGEIDFLCHIANPTHGLITNIGKAHLEGFGGIEGVKKGKSELYKYLAKRKGMVFINLNEKYLEELAKENDKKLLYTISKSPDPTFGPYETKLLATQPFVQVAFLDNKKELLEVNSQLPGAYNFNNIMTAISVGRYFKVPPLKIKAAIENYKSENNRSQIVEQNGNKFLLDAYNANPTSMENALRNFATVDPSSKTVILGDMLELGDYSEKEHQRIYQLALDLGFKQTILVGSEFGKVNVKNETFKFERVESLKEWWDQQSFQNQYFLIKGSRGVRLEKLLA